MEHREPHGPSGAGGAGGEPVRVVSANPRTHHQAMADPAWCERVAIDARLLIPQHVLHHVDGLALAGPAGDPELFRQDMVDFFARC